MIRFKYDFEESTTHTTEFIKILMN